jgi:hypothetical protein
MRASSLAALPLLLLASPALATGSLECRTTDGSDLSVTGAVGHVVGSPIVTAHLRLGRHTLSTTGAEPTLAIARSWLDESELRLDLADAQVSRFEAELRVRRSRFGGTGTLVRDGVSRPVRCVFE